MVADHQARRRPGLVSIGIKMRGDILPRLRDCYERRGKQMVRVDPSATTLFRCFRTATLILSAAGVTCTSPGADQAS